MHLRYDFKTKPDLSNFKTQSSHFLKRGDCVFSFFFEDFSISFDVNKRINLLDGDCWNLKFSIAEIERLPSGDISSKILNPLTDSRIKDLEIISSMFNGSDFSVDKKSIQEIIDFIQFMINCVKKVKKLSALA